MARSDVERAEPIPTAEDAKLHLFGPLYTWSKHPDDLATFTFIDNLYEKGYVISRPVSSDSEDSSSVTVGPDPDGDLLHPHPTPSPHTRQENR